MASSESKQATAKTRTVLLTAAVGPSPVSGEPTVPAERHAMISELAFFMAQARGFTPSQELDDWLAAERQIEHRLGYTDH